MKRMVEEYAEAVAIERTAEDYGGNFYGVYPALVTGLRDADGPRMAQIQVHYPWLAGGEDLRVWARYAAMMAGARRGAWFLPEIGDEVLVAFEAGDVGRPYVIGALWNGIDPPPEAVGPGADGAVRCITTRNGIRITLDDTGGGETVSIETPQGRTLRLADATRAGGGGAVTLSDGLGNEITIRPDGIRARSSVSVEVEAPKVSISAAMVELQTGICRVSGVVQCDTLITNSVVASSYTPGAGNIW